MDDNRIVTLAAKGVLALIVLPVVIGGAMTIVGAVANGVSKIAYNRKIKKGLEDGSIIEVDGEYYVMKPEGN